MSEAAQEYAEPTGRGIIATMRKDGPLQSPTDALLAEMRKLHVLTSELRELDDEEAADSSGE